MKTLEMRKADLKCNAHSMGAHLIVNTRVKQCMHPRRIRRRPSSSKIKTYPELDHDHHPLRRAVVAKALCFRFTRRRSTTRSAMSMGLDSIENRQLSVRMLLFPTVSCPGRFGRLIPANSVQFRRRVWRWPSEAVVKRNAHRRGSFVLPPKPVSARTSATQPIHACIGEQAGKRQTASPRITAPRVSGLLSAFRAHASLSSCRTLKITRIFITSP